MNIRRFTSLASLAVFISSASMLHAVRPLHVPDRGPSLLVTALALAGIIAAGSRLRRLSTRA